MDIRNFFGQGTLKRPRQSTGSSPPKKQQKTSKFFQNEDNESNGTVVISSDEEVIQTPKRQPNIPQKQIAKTPQQSKRTSFIPSQTIHLDILEQSKPQKKQQQQSQGLPLSGKTFVITGILPNSREEVTDMVKEFGGRVTSAVSSRTNYLIYGEKLENGKHYTTGNKYKQALNLGKQLLTYEQFENLISSFEKPKQKVEIVAQQVQNRLLPWVETYKPKNLKQLVGNGQQIKQLIEWLQDWDDVIIKGNKKEVKFNKFKKEQNKNLNAAAALISGPPGIGKTSSVRIIAKGLSYNPLEFNASDCRSQKLIKEIQEKVSGANSLNFSGSICRTLLIMDEVDGMSSGDRGGLGAIVNMIKNTKVPIICICNDRQSQKLKTLANYCLDLKFSKPNKLQILNRMEQILQQEGVSFEKNAVEKLIEGSGNDIRQVIGICEMLARTGQPISYKQQKDYQGKDANVFLNNFDAATKLLKGSETRNLSFKEKMDLFFIDYDLVPLLVYENYLDAIQNQESLEEIADYIAFSDTLNEKIRGQQEWSLLQQYGFFSSIVPGMLGNGMIGFAKFPEFFGKQSKQNKNSRLLKEIKQSLSTSVDKIGVLTDYIPLIWKILIQIIQDEDVQQAVDIMIDLGITPEMLKEHLILLQNPTEKFESDFKKINSKTKAAISRLYNKLNKDSVQRVRKKKSALERDYIDPEVNDVEIWEDDDEEEETLLLNPKESSRVSKPARGKRGGKRGKRG